MLARFFSFLVLHFLALAVVVVSAESAAQTLGNCVPNDKHTACINQPVGTQCDDGTGYAGTCRRLGDNSCECEMRPGYTLSASALTPSPVNPGGSANSTITVTQAPSYSGTIALSCNSGASTSLTCSLVPSSVGNSGSTSTLTVNVASQTPAGSYPVKFTGVDQNGRGPRNGVQSLTLNVSAAATGKCAMVGNTCTVQGGTLCAAGSGAGACGVTHNECDCIAPAYTITVGPFDPSEVVQGNQATSTITIAQKSGETGYVGNVDLSATAPEGMSCSVSPPTISETGPNVSATLTCLTSTSTPVGSQTITVTANSTASGTESSTGTLKVDSLHDHGGGSIALLTFLGLVCMWTVGRIIRRERPVSK